MLGHLPVPKPEWILGIDFKQEAQLSQRDCATLAGVLTFIEFTAAIYRITKSIIFGFNSQTSCLANNES